MPSATGSRWFRAFGPCPVLDRSWGYDRVWERDVVERLRRGASGPRAVYLEVPQTPGVVDARGGWVSAIENTRNADRSRSVHLCDAALAISEPERLRKLKAWEAMLAAQAKRWEAGAPAREAKYQAELEAQRAFLAEQEKRARRRAESDAAWAREAEAREAERRKHDEAWGAKAPWRHRQLLPIPMDDEEVVWPDDSPFPYFRRRG